MKLIKNTYLSFTTRGILKTFVAIYYHTKSLIYKKIGKQFILKNIYDFMMYLDNFDMGISRTLILYGERELEHKLMLEKVLKPGMTVLDIGANIGYYALIELKLIGKKGSLIAVEPSKKNVNLLKKNLSFNNFQNVEVHNKAISDKNGLKNIFMSKMSNLNTFHDTGAGLLNLTGEKIKVETITVPKIMNNKKLDLIRMDVEGHEVEILNGLLPAIKKKIYFPMIIFETHLSRYNKKHDIEKPLREFFKLGYKIELAGSSSLNGSKIIEKRGYKSDLFIRSDGEERKIFNNINDDDAIDLICFKGGIRTVLLKKSK